LIVLQVELWSVPTRICSV